MREVAAQLHDGIELMAFMAGEQFQQVFVGSLLQRRAPGFFGIQPIALAKNLLGAQDFLEADDRFAQQPADQVQALRVVLQGQLRGVDAGATAERLHAVVHVGLRRGIAFQPRTGGGTQAREPLLRRERGAQVRRVRFAVSQCSIWPPDLHPPTASVLRC